MSRNIALVILVFSALLMVSAIGNERAGDTKSTFKPSPEKVCAFSVGEMTILSCDTPLTESGVLALVPPENRFEESASIARTTWKERLALKIIRGKLKKETRQIQAGKKSAAKSQFLALILCFFLGYLGIHRFYLGYVGIGLIQLFTAGLCGIWTFIDFILLIFGGLKPKGEDFG